MPLGDFAEPGTTPRPLAVGRLLRLGFGILLGFFFALNLLFYTDLTESDFPVSTYWFSVVFAWWFFADLVVVGVYRQHIWGGYVNRYVNDIRRRPSQPLIQWRFHPHTVHRDRRLRSTQGPSDA